MTNAEALVQEFQDAVEDYCRERDEGVYPDMRKAKIKMLEVKQRLIAVLEPFSYLPTPLQGSDG